MNETKPNQPDDVIASAQALRWEVGDFHERVMEAIYADAAQIADRVVTRPGEKRRLIWIAPLTGLSPAAYGVFQS